MVDYLNFNQENRIMKAIIYCRVSSQDQVNQGNSLPAQENICKEYAQRNGYKVAKVFVEKGESAKTSDRPKLKELLRYAVHNKNQIDCLLVYKLDRLARNIVDHANIFKLLGDHGIDIKSATENIDDSPAGRAMGNMIGVFAQFENEIRSDRTKMGMKQAIQQGRWCWRAPLGYKTSRDDSNKSIIIPTEKSKYIIEAFALAKKGIYQQNEILNILNQKGFKIKKQQLSKTLRNPLYCGWIKVDWFPEYIDGIHEPIISKETFLLVQDILNGKKSTIAPKKRNHPDFPLRRFVICAECGAPLTASWIKNRWNNKYPYYHCWTKNCSLNIRKEKLEENFYNYLKKIQPDDTIIDVFNAVLLDYWDNRQSKLKSKHAIIQREYNDLLERKQKLLDYMLDEVIDQNTYKTKVQELQILIATKEIELNELTTDKRDLKAYLNYSIYFFKNLSKLWANADYKLKQRLQNLIFPQGILFDKNGYFKPKQIAPIFRLTQNIRALVKNGDPTGIRTPVAGMKTLCPDLTRRWGRNKNITIIIEIEYYYILNLYVN